MILGTPGPVTFVPTATALLIQSVTFDLVQHTVTIVYVPQNGAGPGQGKSITHAIPAALQTAIESHVQAAIEANEGFGAGTTTISTP